MGVPYFWVPSFCRPTMFQEEGTGILSHAVASKPGLWKSAGRTSGLGAQWNFHVPLSDCQYLLFSGSTLRACPTFSKEKNQAWGCSLFRLRSCTDSHSLPVGASSVPYLNPARSWAHAIPDRPANMVHTVRSLLIMSNLYLGFLLSKSTTPATTCHAGIRVDKDIKKNNTFLRKTVFFTFRALNPP